MTIRVSMRVWISTDTGKLYCVLSFSWICRNRNNNTASTLTGTWRHRAQEQQKSRCFQRRLVHSGGQSREDAGLKEQQMGVLKTENVK